MKSPIALIVDDVIAQYLGVYSPLTLPSPPGGEGLGEGERCIAPTY